MKAQNDKAEIVTVRLNNGTVLSGQVFKRDHDTVVFLRASTRSKLFRLAPSQIWTSPILYTVMSGVVNRGGEMMKKEPLFECLECGKKYYSAKSAERAAFGNRGCTKCGGSDIDVYVKKD